MSGPIYAVTPAVFTSPPPVTFTAANTTVAKVLVDAYASAAAAGNAPLFVGGCTVLDILATSSDATNRDVLLYAGQVATTQGTATSTMTTTSSTIPRSTGSFITDGWLVGDIAMVFAPFGTAPNAGVDGIACIVTTVAALTLTVNGTPLAALTLAAGTRVVRVSPYLRATVTAGAGTNGTVANVNLLNNGSDNAVLRYERKLGPADLLIAAMQATVSALPAAVSLSTQIARY